MAAGYWLTPMADAHLDGIADYLAEAASLDIALQFLSAAHRTLSTLSKQPGTGLPCVFGVAGFERILVFYRVEGERLEVLRIKHGAQDLLARFVQEGVN